MARATSITRPAPWRSSASSSRAPGEAQSTIGGAGGHRRFARGLEEQPAGFRVSATDTARALGLGTGTGRNGALHRTIDRACTFGLARRVSDGELHVRTHLPQLNARQLAPTDFEVSLTLDAKAGDGPGLLFKLDLEYGGVFRLINIPQEQIHPIVMIECPRLLFPFVRQIVADATRNGGFPPLYIDPIDFVALYQQKAAQAAGQQVGQA